MKLDFVIIGGQKCGSTYVQNSIGDHPQIAMVEKESPHFESPDFENQGMEKLGSILDKLNKDLLVGIKRPNYLAKPEVPIRIHKINPKCKIIVILRNPLDRFKSAFFHQMNYGVGPVLPINIAAEKLLNGSLSKDYPRTEEILEFGLYGKYLGEYLSLFKDNVLILTFEELKNDKLKLIRKCYHFLGIDEGYIPNKVLESTPMKVNYHLKSVKLLRLRNQFRFKYNHNRTRVYPKNENLFGRLCIKFIQKLNELFFGKISSQVQKPVFNKEIKRRLLDWYLQDIELLERITNKDLSIWKA